MQREIAQRLLVVRLDHSEAVRVLLGENRSEHDHVAPLEVWAPMGGVAVHDRPLGLGEGLGEVRARSDETQDEGGHMVDSTPADGHTRADTTLTIACPPHPWRSPLYQESWICGEPVTARSRVSLSCSPT